MTRPLTVPKYDMRLNPVYQIDYKCEASGKLLAATKRRVKWRFGFSNAAAVRDGKSGVECRGEEHEVVLVWSLASGKRLVLADDEEVHFSKGGKLAERFETSWTMNGGHILKIVANAAPAMFSTPEYRQFDLLLDGFSFFDMPRLYELGSKTPTMSPHSDLRAVGPSSDYEFAASPDGRRREVEEQHIMSNYSMPEYPEDNDAAEVHNANGSEAPQVDRANSMPNMYEDMMSEPVNAPDLFDDGNYNTLLHGAAVAKQDEFVPQPPPPPTFDMVSNQIMSAYNPTTTTTSVALTNGPHCVAGSHPTSTGYQYSPQMATEAPIEVSPDPVHYPQQHSQFRVPTASPVLFDHHLAATSPQDSPIPFDASTGFGYGQQQPYVTPRAPATSPTTTIITPTMEPLALEAIEDQKEPTLSKLEQGLKDLVHLEDITETKETPEQIRAKKDKASKDRIKSKPLPATTPDWTLGFQPALGDIKERAPPKPQSNKEIMRTHAFDPAAVHAGMMVVYGDTRIPAATGFGAGLHHPAMDQQQYFQNPAAGYCTAQPHQLYAA